jgi:hypothetical protein
VVPEVEKMALKIFCIVGSPGSRHNNPPYGSWCSSRKARIVSLSMNGTRSRKSSIDVMSAGVTPAASQV